MIKYRKRTLLTVALGSALLAILIVLIWHNVVDSSNSVFESMMMKRDLDLEDLLGIVSITTFLLGFTSVRLQSTLEEHKLIYSRQVERVLEQNSNQDLLPFPSSFQQHKGTQEIKTWDTVTKATVILTLFLLAISTLFVLRRQELGDQGSTQFWWLQFIHVAIVLIGSSGPYLAKGQFERFMSAQPFPRYQQLREALDRFLDPANPSSTSEELLKAVNDLDESIPEWCWLELIRSSLSIEEKNKKQQYLKRLHKMASPAKEVEEYSLIAFVWSAYLVDSEAEMYKEVRASDLERIMDFSRLHLSLSGRAEPYAELALCEALRSRRNKIERIEMNPMMQAIKEHQEFVAANSHKRNLIST